jgi:DNA excision repair protein ERCC-3
VFTATEKSLIIQGNMMVLLDVHSPYAEEARMALMPFAELEKSPEHIHTYRITRLSLWNAAAAGFSVSSIIRALEDHSRYALPVGFTKKIDDIMSRFGRLKLYAAEGSEEGDLLLVPTDPLIALEIEASSLMKKYLRKTDEGFLVALGNRGTVKWELINMGFPVEDCAPLVTGERLDVSLRTGTSASGKVFHIRDYQREAAAALVGGDGPGTGYGIICLPCGSGKTVVGMAVMDMLKCNTLILTANTAAVHQWITELLDKTTLTREEIAEYSGDKKESAPVTIATYQMMTWRGKRTAKPAARVPVSAPEPASVARMPVQMEPGTVMLPLPPQAALEMPPEVMPAEDFETMPEARETKDFPHFQLFHARPWGLIIYDEVHLLPAPVFRVTAELQAVRRLGLTATLVREDGAETAVFSLVGPKRYDVPWKELEHKGWIAEAFCIEIRVKLPKALSLQYAVSGRDRYRVAAENPMKIAVVRALVAKHSGDYIIVIGQYLDQLKAIAEDLNAPLITGKMPNKKREELYDRFRRGEERIIVVSKVANFAIDLPDASMAIEVSGAYGSRQEEAQRLGRLLRPKERSAFFYTVVSRYTSEEEFASNRQQFLSEQGYKYSIQNWEEAEDENS